MLWKIVLLVMDSVKKLFYFILLATCTTTSQTIESYFKIPQGKILAVYDGEGEIIRTSERRNTKR